MNISSFGHLLALQWTHPWTRIRTLMGIILILMVLGCDSLSTRDPQFRVTPLRHSELEKPIDIMMFKGHYVTPELDSGRLAIFDDLSFSNLRHFVPSTVGKIFHGPHFLSLSPWGTLLISNGRGSSIVEIEDIKGSGWREFGGVDKPFNAPHGICIDDKGWIYVGDSLNSRIVRFRDMAGSGWEVFRDIHRRVSYTRQLAWHDGALWVSNSYEKLPNINPGEGANVLRIKDFSSGRSEVIFEVERTNITGILPLGRHLYVGVWGPYQYIGRVDLNTGNMVEIEGTKSDLGVPYGLFHDPMTGAVLSACFGHLKTNDGGVIRIDMGQS